MGSRGRKSGASLEVIDSGGITTIRRPEPPGELTDEQSEEWRSIVNHLPAEWFSRETHGLLVQYCRHIVASRRVSQLINELESSEGFSVDEYDRLLKMQEREGRALSSLATRMRITQHSTYSDKKTKPRQTTRKPWD